MKNLKQIKNNRGMAMIEALPLIVIFVVLIAFSLGFFSVVHTGILNSIGSRTYAFETFRNRADLTYFRDSGSDKFYHFAQMGNRFHTIEDESYTGSSDGEIHATTREIKFGSTFGIKAEANQLDHNENIYNLQRRNREGGVEVSPAWIMVGYGICIDSRCGD